MGNRFSRGLGTWGLGTWGLGTWGLGTWGRGTWRHGTSKVVLFAGFAGFAFLVTAGARATDRLQALQREADRMASDERTLLGDLRKLEIERQLRAEELKRVGADTVK